MAGPVTYAAILMLARDRIGQIRDLLRGKVQSAAPTDINDIERHLLQLADFAYQYLGGASAMPAPVRTYGPPLDTGISRFALLGAVGLELPSYASDLTPAQHALFHTLHKGTPDQNREAVLTQSTDFVFALWDELKTRIGDPGSDRAKQDLLLGMRAAVLGHMSHIASDVLVHPFLDGLTLPRERAVSALEVHVADHFLQRGVLTRGNTWSDFWPHTVPDTYFEAFSAAARRIYSTPQRKGFGGFEADRSANPEPDLDASALRAGFQNFRFLFEARYSWDLLDWMGGTFWMFIPGLIALPLSALLPQGSLLYRSAEDLTRLDKTLDSGAANYELVTFAFASNALIPLLVTFVSTLRGVRAGAPLIFNWVNSIAWVIVAIVFFATLGETPPEWWQWLFLLAVPLVASAIGTIVSIAGARGNPREIQLALAPVLHLIVSLVFFGLYHGFLHNGAEALVDGEIGAFIGWFLLWLLFLAVMWMGTALILWGAFHDFSVSTAPQDVANPVIGTQSFLRLYDDTMLFRQKLDGAAASDTPSLAERFYPADRRALLKLWWEGDASPPKLRPTGNALVFRHGASDDQTIAAPLEPTTLSELKALLEHTVKDSAGNRSGKLKVAFAFEPVAFEDVELPLGPLFADNAVAADFVDLPTSSDQAYVLYHAPRQGLATRFGRRGAVDLASRAGEPPLSAAARMTTQATATQLKRTAGSDSLFAIFQPGDVIERTDAPVERRVVVSVDADDQISVSIPFVTALAAANFRRIVRDVTTDQAGTGTVAIGPSALELTGTGTFFGAELKPGDTIRIQFPTPPAPAGAPPQDRIVTAVVSDTLLRIDAPYANSFVISAPALPALSFSRVADLERDRMRFMDPLTARDDTVFSGETVLNHAADLAALLMLGATAHVMPDDRRAHAAIPGATQDLSKVHQVFRNWNLDRRRVNEWKMIVLGDAVSEKRGAADGVDPAVNRPTDVAVRVPRGEATATSFGWLPAFRQWLDLARRPEVNTKSQSAFRAHNPTNLALSRALGFLLELPDPDAAAP